MEDNGGRVTLNEFTVFCVFCEESLVITVLRRANMDFASVDGVCEARFGLRSPEWISVGRKRSGQLSRHWGRMMGGLLFESYSNQGRAQQP
jgi:hypothetical protein